MNIRAWTAAALVLVACGGDDRPTDPSDPLAGGVLATFSVEGEIFRVWTDNPIAIADLLALDRGISDASIPNSTLNRGPGPGDHNAPYRWHLDPTDLEMAELTAELCSARPSFVEANVDEWVDVVGQYCPWSAVLVELQDFR